MSAQVVRSARPALLARTAMGGASGLALLLAAASASAQVTPVGTITGTTPNGGNAPNITTPGANTAAAEVTTINLEDPRTIIEWATFVLNAEDTLNFEFDARNDIVLNRVAAGSAQINGALNGTVGGATGGNVWFQATDGVLFGNGAVVNVGGLLATTGAITNTDFRNNNLDFSFNSGAAGQVSVAAGAQINAVGGTIALIAPEVITAAGSQITGDNETDVLYGAAQNFQITFAQEADNDLSLLSFVVPGNALANGSVSATPLAIAGTTNAGTVFVAAVSRSAATAVISLGGLVTATGAAAADGGDIILSGGAAITNRAGGAAAGQTVRAEVGDLTATEDIILRAAGGLTLNGSTIESTGGDVTFNNAVTLAGAAVSVTANDQVRFASTMDGAQDLSASGASVVFDGAVGAATALTSLQVTGPATLNAAGITATGNVTLDELTLGGGGAARTVDAGGALVIGGAVTDGTADTHDLTLRGATIEVEDVGVGGRLASVTFDGPTTLSGDVLAQGAADFLGALTLTDPAGADSVRTVEAGSASFQAILAAAGDEGRLVVDVDGAASFAGDLGVAGDALARLGVSADTVSFAGTNRVERLAADIDSGGLAFTNAEALTVGEVGGLTGVTVGGGGVTLATASGDLQLDEALAAAGQAVVLNSAGTLDQAANAVITAGTLTTASVGGTDLAEDNLVSTIGGMTNTGSGTLRFNNDGNVTATGLISNDAGDVSLSGNDAFDTTGVTAAGGVLIVADSVSTGDLVSGDDILVRATAGDAEVASASAQDDIFVVATGNAVLRAADLAVDGTLLDQLSVAPGIVDNPLARQVLVRSTGAGVAQLGADDAASIVATNTLTVAEAADIRVRSNTGAVRLNLVSTPQQIAELEGGSVQAAVQTGALDILDVDSAGDVILAAETTLNAGTVTVGRDYSITAQDFTGDVLTPGGSIRDLSINDTLGGLAFTNLTAQRNLSLTAGGGGALTGDTATAQTGSVSLTGGSVTMSGAVQAATNVTVSGAAGVSLADVTATDGTIDLAGGGIVAEDLLAGVDIRVASGAGTSIQSAEAGDDIFVTAATGSATLRRAILAADGGAAGVDIDGAGGLDQGGDLRQLVLSASAPGAAATLGADTEAGIAAANDLTVAAGEAAEALITSAGDVRVFLDEVDLNGGPLIVSAGANGSIVVQNGTLDLGTVTVGGDLLARALGGDLSFGAVSAPGSVTLSAGDDLSGTSVNASAGSVDLGGDSVTVSGAVVAGAGSVRAVASAGGASLASASATDDIEVRATGGSAILGAATLTAGVDALADGFNIDVIATGANADAVLGSAGVIAAGNTVSFTDPATDIVVDASAGRDAFVGLSGDADVSAVRGARNASIRTVDSGNGVGGDDLRADTVEAGTGDAVVEAADGTVSLGTITAGQDVSIIGREILSVASLAAGDDLFVQATAAGLTFGNVTAPGDVTLLASGALTGASVTASDGVARLEGASVGVNAVSAGEDVFVRGLSGAAAVGSASAGDDIFVTAQGGTATLGAATLLADADADPVSDFGLGLDTGGTTRQLIVRAEGAGADAVLGAAGAPGAANTVTATLGADPLVVEVVSADRDAIVGLASATRDGPDAFRFGLVQGRRDATVTLTDGALDLGVLSAGDDASARADNGALTVQTATASETVALVDNEGDGSNLSLSASGALTVASATADSDLTLNAGGDVSISTTAQAGDDLFITTPGDVLAAGVDLVAAETLLDPAALGRVDADGLGSNVSVSARDLTIDDILAGNQVLLSLSGDLAFDTIEVCLDGAGGCDPDLTIAAGGDITGATLAAPRDLSVQAGGALTLGTATAGGDLLLSAAAGDLTLSGAATAGDDLTVTAAASRTVTLPTVAALRTGASTDDEAAGTAGAGSNVSITGGQLALGTVRAGSDVNLTALTDGIIAAEVAGGDDVSVQALNGDGDAPGLGQDDVTITTLRADQAAAAVAAGDFDDVEGDGANVAVSAAGDVTVVTGVARGDLSLAGQNVSLTTGRAGRDLSLSASVGVTGDSWRARDDLSAVAGTGDVAVVTAFAGDELRLEGRDVAATALLARQGDVSVADELAGGPGFPAGDEAGDNSNILVLADRDIAVDEAEANGDLTLTAGSRSGGPLAAGSTLTVIGSVLAGDDVDLRAGGALSVGAIEAIRADHGSAPFVDTGAAGSNVVLVGSRVTVGGIQADDDVDATAVTGDVDVNLLVAGAAVRAAAGEDVVLDVADAGTTFEVDAGRDAALGVLTSGGDMAIVAGRDVGAADLDASRDLDIDAGRRLDATTLVAARDMRLSAGTGAAISAATAGDDLTLTAGAVADVDSATATAGDLLVAAGEVRLGSGASGRATTLTATGDVTADDLDAGTTLLVDAGGDVDLGTADSGSDATVLAGGDVSLDDLAAGRDLRIDAAANLTAALLTAGRDAVLTVGGDADITAATAASDVSLTAGGLADLEDVEATSGALTLEAGTLLVGSGAGGTAVVLTADQDVTADDLVAGTTLTVDAGGDATLGTAAAGTELSVTATNVSATDLDAGRDLSVTAAADLTATILTAGRDATLTAGGAATVASATAAANLSLTAGGLADLDDVEAVAGDLTLQAQSLVVGSGSAGAAAVLTADQDLTADSLTAGTTLTVDAGGDATLGTAAAGTDLSVTATNVSATDLDAGQDLSVTAAADLTATTLTAGRDATLTAGDTATITTATAASNLSLTAGGLADLQDVEAVAGDLILQAQAVTVGSGAAGANLTITADQDVAADVLTAGDVLTIDAGGDALIETASAGVDLTIVAADLTATSLDAGQDLSVTVGADLAATTLTAGRNIDLSVGGAATVTSATAGVDLTLQAGGLADLDDVEATAGDLTLQAATLDVGSASAGQAASLTAIDDVIAGTLAAGTNLLVDAGRDASLGVVGAGGDLTLSIGRDLTAATLTSGADADVTVGGDAEVTELTAAQNLTLLSAGAADLGAAEAAAGALVVDAGGSLQADSLSAGTDLAASGSQLSVLAATAGGDLSLTTDGGPLSAETLLSGGTLTLASAGDLDVTAATAAVDAVVSAAGAATVGSIAAGDDILVEAAQATIASARAGTGGVDPDSEANGSNIAVKTSGNAVVTLAEADEDVSVWSTGGDAQLDTATAGDDLFLVAAGTARLGSATLTGAGADLDGDALGAARDAAGNGRQLLVSGADVVVTGAVTTPAGSGVAFEALADLTLEVAGDLNATTLRAGDDIRVSTPTGRLTVQTAEATGTGPDNEADGSNVDLSGQSVRVEQLARAVGDVIVQAAAGEAFVQRAEAGDDIFVRASGGAAQVRGAVLTGLGPNLDSGALDDAAAAGGARNVLSVRATGAAGDVILGAPGAAGAADVLESGDGFVELVAERDVIVDVTSDVRGARATAGGDLSIRTPGALTLGRGLAAPDVTQAGDDLTLQAATIFAEALTTTGLGADGEGDGSNIRAAAAAVTLGTVNAAADVVVEATGGSALIADLTVGDDVFVTASADVEVGALRLTATGLDRDSDGAGDLDVVSAERRAVLRAGNDLRLGLGDPAVAGVFVSAADETAVTLIAGQDVVGASADASLTRVEAGRDFTFEADTLAFRSVGTEVSEVIVGRDLQLTADTLSAESLQAGRDVLLTGANVTVSTALQAGDDVRVTTTELADIAGVRTTGAGEDTEAGGDAEDPGTGADIVILAGGEDGASEAGSVRIAGESASADDFFVITGRTGTATFDGALEAADIGIIRAGDVEIGVDGVVGVGERLDIESLRGGVLLGDGGTLADGLAIDEAEFGRLTAPTLEVYAGSTADSAVRGDLVVGDLTYDPALVQNLSLLAGPANEVRVTGALAPTGQGAGVVRVGRPTSSSGWTPQDIIITGSIGTATTTQGEVVDRTTARTFDQIELNAGRDILMGADDRFVDAIRETDPAGINLTRNRPAGASLAPADLGRIFIASDTLTLRADGKVVQQNTGGAPGRAQGIYLDNDGPDKSGPILTIGTTGSGVGTAGEPIPTIVELFLSFRDDNGQLISRQIAAANPGVVLDEGVVRSNRLRINGCVIGAAGNCTPLADTILIIEPERLLEGLVLAAQDDEEEDDPTITGAGNEEIWRTPE